MNENKLLPFDSFLHIEWLKRAVLSLLYSYIVPQIMEELVKEHIIGWGPQLSLMGVHSVNRTSRRIVSRFQV